MEKIRFISENCKVNDIPEGNGRLFTFFNDEIRLSDLAKKLEITIPEDEEIPEGKSVFISQKSFWEIMNVKGNGIQCFPENEHV